MNEQRSIRDKLLLVLLGIIGLAILSYTTYRAYALSFTHDESLTYLRYVRNSIFETRDANNHFLNSLLMKCSRALFGISELALRLPNLLAHAFFLYFSARIVLTFRSGLLVIVSFIIINLNPYLLEFFSLARGYGLSMGLMMGSLYYAHVYFLQERQKSDILISMAFAALAVTANYMLLNYFLVLCLMFMACEFYYSCNKNVALFLRSMPVLVLIPTGSLLFVLPRIFKLKSIGDFYFRDHGSWTTTLTKLSDLSVYEAGYEETTLNVIRITVFVFIGLGIVISILNLVKGRPERETLYLIFIVSTILFCLLASYAQNIIFRTNFPVFRTALFYIPLLSLMSVFIFNHINSKFIQACFLIIGLLFVSNAAGTLNLTHAITWQYDMNTKEAMKALSNAGVVKSKYKFTTTIGCEPHFKPTIDYYRDKYGMRWLNKAYHIDNYNLYADYYYVEYKSLEQMNENDLTTIMEYPRSKSALLVNQGEQERGLLKEVFVDFEDEVNAYPNTLKKEIVYSGNIANLVGNKPPFSYTYVDTLYKYDYPNPILVSAKMMAYGVKNGFSGGIVISCERDGKFYFWEMSDMKADVVNAATWKPIYLTCTIPPAENEYHILKVFLFNNGDGDIYIDDFHIKIIDPKN